MNERKGLRKIGIKLKKVQFVTSICQLPNNVVRAIGAERLRERGYPAEIGECIRDLVEELRNMDGLRDCTHSGSKHTVFRLEDDPGSMIQISSRGKIIITAGSPDSFMKIHRMLLEALWLSGYSSDVLETIKAKVYKVEEYEVKSLEDVESLFRHQTIVGARRWQTGS